MRKIFRRQIAITHEHGSWVFLLMPLLIGLFVGRSWQLVSVYLSAAALCAFLVRHPVTIAVKAISGRRSRQDLPAAWFWIGVYGGIGASMVLGLALRGYAYLLLLALPGIQVFLWHLVLVSRRQERRQMGVELVASGVLALSAPAAYWIGAGGPDLLGWGLWGLVWLQSAASIVYAYLRLEQRTLKETPPLRARWQMARRALLYSTFNLLLTLGLSLSGWLPALLFLPYLLQWLETLWGSLVRPAVGFKPSRIGLRQLAVSSLFTVLFILVWRG
jgi:hypothetical protein